MELHQIRLGVKMENPSGWAIDEAFGLHSCVGIAQPI
jgi:hypothetical protein